MLVAVPPPTAKLDGRRSTYGLVAILSSAESLMPHPPTRLTTACLFAAVMLCSLATNGEGQVIARPAPNTIMRQHVDFTTSTFQNSPASFAKALHAQGLLGDGSRDHRYKGFWLGVGAASAYTILKLLACNGGERRCDRDRIAFADGPPLAISLALAGAVYGSTRPKQLPADSARP